MPTFTGHLLSARHHVNKVRCVPRKRDFLPPTRRWSMETPPRQPQRAPTPGALPRLGQQSADPCGACPSRTPRSPKRTLFQSLGARQSPDRPATPCRRPCRAARRGCPSAQPAATRAPRRAPPPPAGRTRRRRGLPARRAARAAPRAHCGLRACT
jgi:hypothetical protein